MLLTLLQLNLSRTARLSWAQTQPITPATLAADVETALPLAPFSAPQATITWAQTLPQLGVVTAFDVETALPLSAGAVGGVTLAQDTEAAFPLSPLAAIAARITWAQTLAAPAGAVITALDVETAFQLAPLGSATATITWAQTVLQPVAVVDPRVRGTWSPALLSRWLLLDTGAVPALDVETAYALPPGADAGGPAVVARDTETAIPRPPAITTVTAALDLEIAFPLAGYVKPPLTAALVAPRAEDRIFHPQAEQRVWRAPEENRTWRPLP